MRPGRPGSDPLRFALGTLTRVPVPSPRKLDPGIAGSGLALGPLIGLLLGGASGLPLLALGGDTPLLGAVLGVAGAAWLTRALHWDGLADLADGLASARPAAGALAIMRASDIGPFGTLTLVLTALVQVTALAGLLLPATALGAWIIAQVLARLALGLACGPWFRAARPDGLGALVIGSVRGARLVLLIGLAAGLAWAVGEFAGFPVVLVMLAAAAAAGVATVVGVVAARRLGGSTGDVLGATVELAVATALVVLVVGS